MVLNRNLPWLLSLALLQGGDCRLAFAMIGSMCFVIVSRSAAGESDPLLAKQEKHHSTTGGDAAIRGKAGSSEIVITTTTRVAGAIHSLTWGGKEFIDSQDHGRQLQSACSFDCGDSARFWPEAFNPTEAGSRADGAGPTSSSKLLSLAADGNVLESTTQMAFWLAPGEDSMGHPARNDTILSRHRLRKRVQIGYENQPHAIEYKVAFHVPDGERHSFAQFEALTGYMPAEFSRFWILHTVEDELRAIDDGPGEQNFPVIFSTADGRYAMGVYSPDQPSPGFEAVGYGRFRFQAEKVVKWNCVFRVRGKDFIRAGEYSFRMFVAVGNLQDARLTLGGLRRVFDRSKPRP